ncbi:MAG: zeta toxin family protein [Bacteriovoracia bacterium]
MKQLWILTGGNGSGKSTFFKIMLKPLGVSFVNADMLALTLGEPITDEKSRQAQKMALALFHEKISKGDNFCFETVFSHPSKLELIREAQESGYEVTLVYIHLANDSLNQARVYQRVAEGGHNVPADKIKSRIPRTMENVHLALPMVRDAVLYDNSYSESNGGAFQEIAQVHQGTVVSSIDPLPAWATEMLAGLSH